MNSKFGPARIRRISTKCADFVNPGPVSRPVITRRSSSQCPPRSSYSHCPLLRCPSNHTLFLPVLPLLQRSGGRLSLLPLLCNLMHFVYFTSSAISSRFFRTKLETDASVFKMDSSAISYRFQFQVLVHEFSLPNSGKSAADYQFL
jgi:hypothetical protein